MEVSTEIESTLWIGTFLMLFLTFGLIVLAATYQRHYFKMKRAEAVTMLKACIETEERERNRIAADLHDSVLGDLSAIKNYISILKKSAADSKNTSILNEISDGIEGALQNTRTISYNLMPPLLQAQGLIAAVDNYYKGLTHKTGIKFTCLPGANLTLEPQVSYHIFRIIQELTTNMIKYGNVTRADIAFDKNDEETVITITDNGIPFNFTLSLSESKGNGLRNILSRLQVIGAAIKQYNDKGINYYRIILK